MNSVVFSCSKYAICIDPNHIIFTVYQTWLQSTYIHIECKVYLVGAQLYTYNQGRSSLKEANDWVHECIQHICNN